MIITSNSSNELDKLLKETQRDEAAKTSSDIYAYIKKHERVVVRDFKGYIKYFEDYFDILNNTITTLNYLEKKTWPQYKNIQYLLFPDTLKTLHRAFEDIIAGYYDEAMILLRSVYEAYVRMIFVACYPNDYEAIFLDRKGKRNLNITDFVTKDLNFDWGFIYRLMCKIAHAKIHLVLQRLIAISTGKSKDLIALEYKYDKKTISMPINISTFLLYALFNFTFVSFKEDFDKSNAANKEHIILMSKVDKALRGILESLPNRLNIIAKDIDKIDRIIQEVKLGKDWKKLA